MIREIQLYIGDQRVELFGDETISITDSIKNAKDISKVFTTFSQQFTVPASKNNNKIFKHFYNYDIDNAYAFDARKKVAARLEINYLPFRNGRLKLDGVELRNNAPYAYRITFYGSVVDLKDVLGEDKLTELTDFQGVTKSLSINNLISDLTQNSNADYALALITAEQRLYYDTENPSQGSGNIYYDGATPQGLKPQQLKYGVKLRKILEAIEAEEDYGLSFASNSFFNPSESNELDEIYMWLHRKKGVVEYVSGNEQIVPFFEQAEADKFTSVSNNIITLLEGCDEIDLNVTPSSDYPFYDLILYRKDNSESEFEVLQRKDKVQGFQSLGFGIGPTNLKAGDQFKVSIRTYEESITLDEVDIEFTQDLGGGSETTDDYIVVGFTVAAGFSFGIAENMPEMKVIDFLSGLFQLFNLVAYVDEDGELVTQTLDEFYRIGNSYDISKYIDISRSTVDSALPFKEIFFKYKDTKTILAEQHLQEISDVEWGGVEYTTDNDLSGEIYKVEPPFHHAKYEKLLNSSNISDSSDVQFGYFVTDNEEAYLGSPLLYYIVPQTSGIRISYVREGNLINSPALEGSINMPSNSKSFDPEVSEANIHFNAEINEFAGVEFEDTLFKRYYEKYIQSVFNQRNRLTKVTAYLPVSILREIALNDTIIINGRSYIINSMQINVNTGKTSFELLNKYTVNAIWGQVEQTWSSINTNWGVI